MAWYPSVRLFPKLMTVMICGCSALWIIAFGFSQKKRWHCKLSICGYNVTSGMHNGIHNEIASCLRCTTYVIPYRIHNRKYVSSYRARAIERLRLTSQTVKHPQHSSFYSVSLIRLQGKKVASSTVILETQAAWHLPSTTVSTVTVAQLPCQLNWVATWPGVQVRQ